MAGHHSHGLVLLSIAIACLASYVCFNLANRVAEATGPSRRRWLVGGALSMGVGIWSMHYVGMLAFSLPIPVRYDVPTVLLSVLPAVLASALGLAIVARQRLTLVGTVTGGIVMGGGIAAMHYIGMAAMRFAGTVRYEPGLVAVSVAVAVVVSWVALLMLFRLRGDTRALAPGRLLSAGLMGLAIAGMHYSGMAAARFEAGQLPPDGAAVSVSSLGIVAIVLVASMVLALAALSTRFDQRLARQAAALERSERRYRLLFDRSLAGVYQCQLDGRMTDCNNAFAAMLGLPSREMTLAENAAHLFADAAAYESWLNDMRTHRVCADVEHRLRRYDGSTIWALHSATLVEPNGDDPALIEGTVVDITKRKAAEAHVEMLAATLGASAERYRKLVETTNAIPWEMDGASLTFRYMSPQVQRLFRYDDVLAVGTLDVWDRVHEPDRARVQRELAALAASLDPHGLDTEFRLVTGFSRIAYVRSVVSASCDAGTGTVLLRGITVDVTRQRELEGELRQAQKLESLGRLSAGVAHEINTPVQFVSDSVAFVRDGVAAIVDVLEQHRAARRAWPQNENQEERVALAEAESAADLDYYLREVPQALALSAEGLERVGTIVRSMKEYAHPGTRQMGPTDLNRLLTTVMTMATHEYRHVADLEIDLGTLPSVVCLGSDVSQAVLNVVVNAAHAVEQRFKGGGGRGRIAVRTRHVGRMAVVAIADTGGGIPDDVARRVFDPFFTTKGVGDGTGQGLTLARRIIVDQHGGEVDFVTQPGEGTTFNIRLPITPRQALTGVSAAS